MALLNSEFAGETVGLTASASSAQASSQPEGGLGMGDEVYALFIVVLALTPLAMPITVQPGFVVLAGTLAALAYSAAAEPATPQRLENESHDISDS
jgi:hypothetical protein